MIVSDCFIAAPSGIGTVLEAMMIWQLLQLEHITDFPLILVHKMWPHLVEWASAYTLSTDPPLANPEDMAIPRCVASAEQAIALIRKHHGKCLRKQGR